MLVGREITLGVGRQRLQGFEDELRVASGVARDRRSQRPRREKWQLQRQQQFLDGGQRQRRQGDLLEAMGLDQRAVQQRQQRFALSRPGAEHEPRHAGHDADPREQLDAGEVGEMQVVDDRCRHRGTGTDQRLFDRRFEAATVELRCRGLATLGHDARELGPHRVCRLHADREQGAQQPRQNDVRAVLVAGPALHQHRSLRGQVFLQQAALAHAGVAEHEHV